MKKFEMVMVGIAYVAKLLIGAAGMVATGLLGLSDLPAGWKFPLMAVAAVAAGLGLYKTPNGPSIGTVKLWAQMDQWIRTLPTPPAPTSDPEPPADPADPAGPEPEGV